METSTTKQSVKDYEILDDTPPWAIALFDKVFHSIIFSSIQLIFLIKFTDEIRDLRGSARQDCLHS